MPPAASAPPPARRRVPARHAAAGVRQAYVEEHQAKAPRRHTPSSAIGRIRARPGPHARPAIQRRDFPEPSLLSGEAHFTYLPLLRGLMFEADNVAWCDRAIAAIAMLAGATPPPPGA